MSAQRITAFDPERKVRIVAVGRFSPEKRAELQALLDAVASLIKAGGVFSLRAEPLDRRDA